MKMNGKSDKSDIPSGSPADWPCSLAELKELDTILRCGICFEYMTTAMMLTKCSHNYCSLCIRRYIIYKQQCPTCIENVLESDLRNNRLLDDVIRIFTSSRTKLLNIAKSTAMSSDEPMASSSNLKSSSSSASVKDKSSSANESTVPKKSLLAWDDSSDSDATMDNKTMTTTSAGKKEITVEKKGDEISKVSNDVEIKNSSDTFAPNSSVGSQRTPIFFPKVSSSSGTLHSVRSPSYSPVISPASTSTVNTIISPSSVLIANPLTSPRASSSKKVPCPVCSVQVPETYINIHLDRCLATDSKKEALRSHGTPKRKTMPKLVYNLMKDNDIRKKLMEVGLPTQGDRQKLIKRHQEFTLIYNSQCDSLNPKSTEEIVREMLKSDLKKSEPAARVPPAQIIKVNKNASSKDIEDAQKEYVKKHKSQFSELLEAAKRSWKSKKLNADNASRSTAASNDESSLMGDEESTKMGQQADDLKKGNVEDTSSAMNNKGVSDDDQSKDDHPDRLSTSYQDVDGHMSMSGGHRGKMTKVVASDTIPFVNGTKDDGCPSDKENLFEESSLLNSSSKQLNASVNPADISTMSQTKDKKQKKKNRNMASRRRRLDSSSSVDFDLFSNAVIDTPSEKRTTRPRRSTVKHKNLDESAVVDTDEDDGDDEIRRETEERNQKPKKQETSNLKNVKVRKNEKKPVKSTEDVVEPVKSTDDLSDVNWTAAGDKNEEHEMKCSDSDDDLDISLTQNIPKQKLKRKASSRGHAMPAELSSDVDASVTGKNLKKKRKLAYNEDTSKVKPVEDASVWKSRGRKPKARDQCSEEAV